MFSMVDRERGERPTVREEERRRETSAPRQNKDTFQVLVLAGFG
jgi:hypothetical protein